MELADHEKKIGMPFKRGRVELADTSKLAPKKGVDKMAGTAESTVDAGTKMKKTAAKARSATRHGPSAWR